jgi:hypothetical protein
MINHKFIEGIERRMKARDCKEEPFRIVFWRLDSESMLREIKEYKEAFEKKGWVLIDPAVTGPLAFKSRILDEPDTRFVVLQYNEMPQNRDPLLDLRLAYPVFYADMSTIYLDEIDLGSRMDLQDYLKNRDQFFRKKENREKLMKLRIFPLSSYVLAWIVFFGRCSKRITAISTKNRGSRVSFSK